LANSGVVGSSCNLQIPADHSDRAFDINTRLHDPAANLIFPDFGMRTQDLNMASSENI
tara:strand:+ start:5716 stop:5889 length:174 start_codon:yes stop_codon:yes gene_type:complete